MRGIIYIFLGFMAVILVLVVGGAFWSAHRERQRVTEQCIEFCRVRQWKFVKLQIYKNHYTMSLDDSGVIKNQKFRLIKSQVELI